MSWRNTNTVTFLTHTGASVTGENVSVSLFFWPENTNARYALGLSNNNAGTTARLALGWEANGTGGNAARKVARMLGKSNGGATGRTWDSSDWPIIDGQWNNIVVTKSGTGTTAFSLYVNGTFIRNSSTYSTTFSGEQPSILTIARAFVDSATTLAQGYFAEVAVYDGTVLVQSQVTELQTKYPNAITGDTPSFYARLFDSLTPTIGSGDFTQTNSNASFVTGTHPALSGSGSSIAPIAASYYRMLGNS